MEKLNQDAIRRIVENRSYEKMILGPEFPSPGQYVIAGFQVGNINGELGWDKYLGYVVQVRKKAGSFGSHLVIMRHPDGGMWQHHNQSFHRISAEDMKRVKSCFLKDVKPENEDYTIPIALGDGKYPETGKIIESKEDGPPVDNSPLMAITTVKANGKKTVTIC